ncbi:muconolactone Delta-isomerase family protein [Bradyrhizobium tropiciagri]|uniref:muconolactone Delta-isomerase family protein n=1 Tax=Bradyrhizobium tropiciagri TaxID=312253 RepID=UPI000B098E2D|nr:muconolactone Delta-isomerase family protein [Bradyrhizobium tropiciagri]
MKTIRHTILALTLTLTGATTMTAPSPAQAQAQGQAQAIHTITTGVIVILTVKADVTREQVMAVMPDEIRQTVQLYLNGKVREWYSRADGRGVVFLLDAKDTAEAHTIMEGLPLSKLDIMDHDYIAVGPLLPLRLLVGKS